MDFEQSIKQVEQLYERVTGKATPTEPVNNSPINSEIDPIQMLNMRVDQLLMALADPTIVRHLAPWTPKVAVWESDSQVIFRMELSGVKKDEVDISVVGHQLVISGIRRSPMRDSGYLTRFSELPLGPFRRVIPMSPGLNLSEIGSNLKEGMLEVTVPKQGVQTSTGKAAAKKANSSVQ